VEKNRIDELIESKEKQEDSKDIPFLKSLQSWFDKTGNLSEKQLKALERIEYLNSPEGKRDVASWIEEYPRQHKEKALVCARYYLANPPYFSDIAQRIVTIPDYIPSRNQFKAMCENKFTTKVWKEYNREPLYAKGDIVQIRDARTLPYSVAFMRKKLCVVVENKVPTIATHAQGSKVYRLLPFGSTSIVECQERHIKAFKNKA